MSVYVTEAGNKVQTFKTVRIGANRRRVLEVGKPFTTQGSGTTGEVLQIDRRYNKYGKVIPHVFSVRLLVDGVERWTTADFR